MKIFFIGIGGLVLVAIVAIFFLPAQNGSSVSNDPDILGTGIHWHPRLEIFVKGEKVEIPQNIGIGAVHQPMHTHDDLPIIHLEFQGIVRKENVRLGRFFEIWGRDMNSFGSNMRMTVNGSPSSEYDNYVMHDGDKIVLTYE